MKRHEPIYNVYTFLEAGELRSIGIKQYYRQGSDKKKLAFLQSRATFDFSSAKRVPLATPMSREEYHARERMGQTLANYLFKYADYEAKAFNIPALINDDYFNAIRLLFNNQHFISCLKLLMSFVGTIAHVEFGDRPPRETPVFIDWLRTFADGELAEATPEEFGSSETDYCTCPTWSRGRWRPARSRS